MSAKNLKLIVFIVLFAQGIGHYMGVVTALGFKLSNSSSYESWFFSNLLGEKMTRIICLMIYLLAFLGFVASALSFKDWLIPHDFWQTLAFYSAIISLFGVVFFWNGLAFTFNKIGAIIVNLMVILSIQWLHWPEDIFE